MWCPFRYKTIFYKKIERPFSNTSLNLLYIIFFHSSLLGRQSLQIHFKSITLFLAINDPIPRLPLSLSRTTTLHWTLQFFLILIVLDYKNLHWMEVSKQHIPFGIRKIDMKYKVREFNTLFIRQMWLVMLNILHFPRSEFLSKLINGLVRFFKLLSTQIDNPYSRRILGHIWYSQTRIDVSFI